jgi:uncharacterized OsmC-like protein
VDTTGLTATVTGEVERGGDASVLRAVHVRFRLPVTAETDRSKIDRVMGFHAQHCGIYKSLHPQVRMSTELELVPA